MSCKKWEAALLALGTVAAVVVISQGSVLLALRAEGAGLKQQQGLVEVDS